MDPPPPSTHLNPNPQRVYVVFRRDLARVAAHPDDAIIYTSIIANNRKQTVISLKLAAYLIKQVLEA